MASTISSPQYASPLDKTPLVIFGSDKILSAEIEVLLVLCDEIFKNPYARVRQWSIDDKTLKDRDQLYLCFFYDKGTLFDVDRLMDIRDHNKSKILGVYVAPSVDDKYASVQVKYSKIPLRSDSNSNNVNTANKKRKEND